MLLDLMAARLENRRIAVSSLCAADPEDGRRVFIELADEMAQRLEA